MFKAAPFHDIGKVAIPDHILLKPGPLNDEEWEIMKTHAAIGESVLRASATDNNSDDAVINSAINIAGCHHERWDGTGYPYGLKSGYITLEERIMSLADMYDALVTKRPYKDGWSHQDAVKEIVSKNGTFFDPTVVEAFMQEDGTFQRIAKQYQD
jgi:response regulator RpfG family c-di-GMP phosphodiesterase